LRSAGSVLSPSPNSRSKAARGFTSAGTGTVGERHDIDMYAQV
jgi:hypothetical protein